TCWPTRSKAALRRLVIQTSAPPEYVNSPGNLSFFPVVMSPAMTELPLIWYPTSMWGEIRERRDQTTNGLNPAAPAPRKFRASPEGTRTSTPRANAAFSAFHTTPFTRNVMSPMPEAIAALEDELVRHGEQPRRSGN